VTVAAVAAKDPSDATRIRNPLGRAIGSSLRVTGRILVQTKGIAMTMPQAMTRFCGAARANDADRAGLQRGDVVQHVNR
jgi:hypothetical protein